MKYEKTEDPNIIKKIETIESEIYLDKLQEDINSLQIQLDSIPKPKEKPDQETLDCYNMEIEMMNDPMIEVSLKDKKELLNKLKSL